MAAEVPVLTFVSGAQPGETFPLGPTGDSWVAGRSNDADLVLEDDTVSRKHARIYESRGTLWLRDLGSRNGTQINGRTVRHHRLRIGDRLVIGANLLRLDSVPISQLEKPSPSESTSGRSMSGSIQDIPLADVLQWLATSRKTGTLRVRGRSTGELFLRSGAIYYARIEGSEGMAAEKALLRMMTWSDGTFELDNVAAEIDEKDELNISLDHLLMESARIQDELAHLAERKKVPGTEINLVFPPPKPWRELEPEQLDLIQLIAEGLDWPTVLNRSTIDDVAATKTAIALLKVGVVEY